MAKNPPPAAWAQFTSDLIALFTKYNGVLYRIRVPERLATWVATTLPLILLLTGGAPTEQTQIKGNVRAFVPRISKAR